MMDPAQEENGDGDISTIVDQYLRAIGIVSSRGCSLSPSFENLCELQRRHLDTFAFSSVDPRLGNNKTLLSLDTKSLFETIVLKKRGGYCFQQNKLFYDVLQHLGYTVRLVLGRVTNNREKNFRPGLTHRFTVVSFPQQRSFAVDVSFGSKCPPAPVPLEQGREMIDKDYSRKFRVYHSSNDDPDPMHMQVFLPMDGIWFTTFKFNLAMTYSEADSEVGHFYSHQHPAAIFVNHLYVSKRRTEDILQLHNLSLQIINPYDGKVVETNDVTSSTELQMILRDLFDICVSEEESLQLFTKSKKNNNK
mmetsp:Transcript_14213/g.21004  ORF Transcript_14213/g.21004 Transcript_14213/m.21004 type:complete len:305 (+) Transcript_14213:75-989(+)